MGPTDCRRWQGWGIANVHVGPEQFQACQLQAGRLRTGCQPWEEAEGRGRERLTGLMMVRRGKREKAGVMGGEGLW